MMWHCSVLSDIHNEIDSFARSSHPDDEIPWPLRKGRSVLPEPVLCDHPGSFSSRQTQGEEKSAMSFNTKSSLAHRHALLNNPQPCQEDNALHSR